MRTGYVAATMGLSTTTSAPSSTAGKTQTSTADTFHPFGGNTGGGNESGTLVRNLVAVERWRSRRPDDEGRRCRIMRPMDELHVWRRASGRGKLGSWFSFRSKHPRL